MKIRHDHILREVFRRTKTKSEMARLLSVSRQYVSAWTKVPLIHVAAISRITKIPKKILRPDVFN